METIRDESDNSCLRRRVFQVQVAISIRVQKQADLAEVIVFFQARLHSDIYIYIFFF